MEGTPGEDTGARQDIDHLVATHAERIRERVRCSRSLTVFLSSPFGGMELERAELVQRHLPSLRALAESRGVQLALVDLRWGITVEQANASLVIPLCLKEIDRCDVFVGFLGARYGTAGEDNQFIQKSIDKALPQWGWLAEMRDRSITELEFRQGCLLDPTERPGLFFLRDPEYDTKEALSSPEGQYKYTIESNESAVLKAALLSELEQMSADGKLGLVREYADPAAGAAKIAEQLSAILHAVLPSTAPDQGTREDTEHFNFCVSRVGSLFQGREEELEQLLQYVTSNTSKPLVVTGETGAGKSSLLSKLFLEASQLPGINAVAHFVGASGHSAKQSSMVSRLSRHLLRFAGREEVTQNMSLEDAMRAASCAAKLQGGRVLLVLDALNELELSGHTPLHWLPKVLPEGVRVVVSALPGAALDELVGRGAMQLQVNGLSIRAQHRFIERWLSLHGKRLEPENVRRIGLHQASDNPLFLSVLLAELTVFGEFETLQAKLDSLLLASDLKTLVAQVMQRLEEVFDVENPQVLALVLQLLWCARTGLAPAALAAIVSRALPKSPVTPYQWKCMLDALDCLLLCQSGFLVLRHDFIRQCVRKRYFGVMRGPPSPEPGMHRAVSSHRTLQHRDKVKAIHGMLAEHLHSLWEQKRCQHQIESEMALHCLSSGRWDLLESGLSDPRLAHSCFTKTSEITGSQGEPRWPVQRCTLEHSAIPSAGAASIFRALQTRALPVDLRMCGNHLDWTAIEPLKALLEEGKLVALELSGCPLFDDTKLKWPMPLKFASSVAGLGLALGSNTSLRRLVLNQCGVTAGIVASLGQGLQQNRSLQLVSLSGCQLPIENIRNGTEVRLARRSLQACDAMLVAILMQQNTVCKVMDIDHNLELGGRLGERDESGCVELLKTLAAHPTLEEFNFSRTGMTDKCAPALGKLFSSKSLRTVVASYSRFTGQGAKTFAPALAQSSLKVLVLKCSNLGNQGAVAIAEAVKHNTHLERLSLYATEIDCAAVRPICTMLSQAKSLRELDLSSNDIGVEGAKCLSEIQRETDSPVAIDLRHNLVESEVETQSAVGVCQFMQGLGYEPCVTGPEGPAKGQIGPDAKFISAISNEIARKAITSATAAVLTPSTSLDSVASSSTTTGTGSPPMACDSSSEVSDASFLAGASPAGSIPAGTPPSMACDSSSEVSDVSFLAGASPVSSVPATVRFAASVDSEHSSEPPTPPSDPAMTDAVFALSGIFQTVEATLSVPSDPPDDPKFEFAESISPAVRAQLRCTFSNAVLHQPEITNTDELVLYELFCHYTAPPEGSGQAFMNHSQYRAFLKALRLKNSRFTLAHADLVFQGCNKDRDTGKGVVPKARTPRRESRSNSLITPKQNCTAPEQSQWVKSPHGRGVSKVYPPPPKPTEPKSARKKQPKRPKSATPPRQGSRRQTTPTAKTPEHSPHRSSEAQLRKTWPKAQRAEEVEMPGGELPPPSKGMPEQRPSSTGREKKSSTLETRSPTRERQNSTPESSRVVHPRRQLRAKDTKLQFREFKMLVGALALQLAGPAREAIFFQKKVLPLVESVVLSPKGGNSTSSSAPPTPRPMSPKSPKNLRLIKTKSIQRDLQHPLVSGYGMAFKKGVAVLYL